MADTWTSRPAYQAALNRMNTFLNPPKGSMDGPSYAALRAQRMQQWNNFVKNGGKL